MEESDSRLFREEIRAIFALGIIGTIFAVKDALGIQFGFKDGFNAIVTSFVLYWGAYIFLMTIGVSDDWINPSIAETCAFFAKASFVIGIAATLAFIPMVAIATAFPFLLDSTAGKILMGVIASILGIYLVRKLRNPSDSYPT
jgi:hypothetical protein